MQEKRLEYLVKNLSIYDDIPEDNVRALIINEIESMPARIKRAGFSFTLTRKDMGYWIEAIKNVRLKLVKMHDNLEKRKANRLYKKDGKDFGLVNRRIYIASKELQHKYRSVKVDYIKAMIEGLLEGRAVKYLDDVVSEVRIYLEDKRIRDANRFGFKKQ